MREDEDMENKDEWNGMVRIGCKMVAKQLTPPTLFNVDPMAVLGDPLLVANPLLAERLPQPLHHVQ
eukprot:6933789-Pyramimonas_sp.AAC.1